MDLIIIFTPDHAINKAGKREGGNKYGQFAYKFSPAGKKGLTGLAGIYHIIAYAIKEAAEVAKGKNDGKEYFGEKDNEEKTEHVFVERRHAARYTKTAGPGNKYYRYPYRYYQEPPGNQLPQHCRAPIGSKRF